VRGEDIRIDLSRAIQSLPEHYREVILLRDIEELSFACQPQHSQPGKFLR
jgi:DNA-directed RNA polymerase specialized sigma24 family protein